MTDADILDRYQDGGQVSPWARDAVAFTITNKLLEPGDRSEEHTSELQSPQ